MSRLMVKMKGFTVKQFTERQRQRRSSQRVEQIEKTE